MSQITREEARDIAKSSFGSIFHIEVTDIWNAERSIYAADMFTDCWYITFIVILRRMRH
jgi:hypothetical protein